MAANPSLPIANHRQLEVDEHNPRLGGYANLLAKELGDWFHNRRWLRKALFWVGLIDVLVALILFAGPAASGEASGADPASPPGEMAIQLVLSFIVLGGSIGTIIQSQDEIIGEKLSGTAAWILSKPVARAAFILAKLVANTIGTLVFIVLIPGLVGYGEAWFAGGQAPALAPYLAGLGGAGLTLLFYLTLSIMLGVLFEHRGPVLGISLGLLLGGSVAINMLPAIAAILPVAMHQICPAIALGQPLPQVAWIELIVTAAWCVVFVLVAVWRFEKLEM